MTHRRRTLARRIALLTLSIAFSGAQAQPPAQNSAEDGSVATIHVYSHLLQIPVLILGPQRQQVPLIPSSKFRVELMGGPTIVPRSVRLEGDDPITLGLVIDNSVENPLLEKLPERLADMAPKVLQPHDRVTVYSTDGCHLRRHSELVSPTKEALHTLGEEALKHPPFRGDRTECRGPRHLWDAMAYVDTALAGQPGRRVLLAITLGSDSGSSYPPARLQTYATDSGVTMFAIAPPLFASVNPNGVRSAATVQGTDLSRVAEASGGMVLNSTAGSMPGTLKHFVELLHGRYIVEFPRPANLNLSSYTFTVTYGAPPNYFTAAGGTMMPMNEPPSAVGQTIAVPGAAAKPAEPAPKP